MSGGHVGNLWTLGQPLAQRGISARHDGENPADGSRQVAATDLRGRLEGVILERLDHAGACDLCNVRGGPMPARVGDDRSEEHTSELQSQSNLVCRLLLEKKKK